MALGCTFLNPLGDYERGRPAVAPSDASDAGADAFDGYFCEPTRWPQRPATGAGPAGDLSLVFAIQTFSFEADPTDAGLPIGYDLDDTCTCPGPESCKRPRGEPPACDPEGGIDNGGGEVLSSIVTVTGAQNDVNEKLASGAYGLLFRVKGYNGLPNDPQIVFEMFFSHGTDGVQDGGSPTPPRFDGTDVYTIDPESAVGTSPSSYISPFFDTEAYVADDVVVAHIDKAPVRIGPVQERIYGGVVVAKLARDGADVRIADGRLVGRVSAAELLTSLDVLQDKSVRDGGGVCPGSPPYQVVEKLVCGAVDVTANPTLGADSPCDALAIAARFTARPARLGPIYAPPPRPHLCGPSWEASCPQR